MRVALAQLVAVAAIIASAQQVAAQRQALDAHEVSPIVAPSMVMVRAHARGELVVGSGVVLSSHGWIVTNEHVVAHSPRVEVWLSRAGLWERHLADVVETDADADLALLRIDAIDLIPIRFGDVEALRPGTPVAALGFPEGIFMAQGQYRVIAGVVLQAYIPQSAGSGAGWVVSDVSVRPGNSGGPLVDAAGALVGINAVRRDDPETSLSIPVSEVVRFVGRIGDGREQRVAEWGERRRRADTLGERAGRAVAEGRAGPVTSELLFEGRAELERLALASATAFSQGNWVEFRDRVELARAYEQQMEALLENLR